MRPFVLVLILAFAAGSLTASRNGARVEYLGGTRGDIPTNKNGEIRMTDDIFFLFLTRKTEVKIPYDRINLLEYGQKVNRRYVAAVVFSPLFLNAKKREHYLTVGFQDDNGRQQALIFRVEKDDVRVALVSLEARTGQKVEFQDEEARIAGLG